MNPEYPVVIQVFFVVAVFNIIREILNREKRTSIINVVKNDFKEEIGKRKKVDLSHVWFIVLWFFVILGSLSTQYTCVVLSIGLACYTIASLLYRAIRLLEKIYRRINEDRFEE